MADKRELITVDKAERTRLKEAREGRGWRQKDLAVRAKTTAPTISNIETGRHPQIDKQLYMRLQRVLFGPENDAEADETDDAFRTIAAGVPKLNAQEMRAVAALVETLKKPG